MRRGLLLKSAISITWSVNQDSLAGTCSTDALPRIKRPELPGVLASKQRD